MLLCDGASYRKSLEIGNKRYLSELLSQHGCSWIHSHFLSVRVLDFSKWREQLEISDLPQNKLRPGTCDVVGSGDIGCQVIRSDSSKLSSSLACVL